MLHAKEELKAIFKNRAPPSHFQGNTYVRLSDEEKKRFSKKEINAENTFKILGYFPVVGTFIGIGRLLRLLTKTGRENYSAHNIERGVLETLSLGFINLPIDLIVQNIKKKSNDEKVDEPSQRQDY